MCVCVLVLVLLGGGVVSSASSWLGLVGPRQAQAQAQTLCLWDPGRSFAVCVETQLLKALELGSCEGEKAERETRV